MPRLPSWLCICLAIAAGFGLGFILGVPVHERSLFAPDLPALLRNPSNQESLFTTARPLSTLRPEEIKKELTYLSSQPPGPEIDRRVNALLWRWGGIDPSTAVPEALRILADRGEDSPILHVVWSWSQTNPPAAARWARDFPAPAQQERFVRDAYSAWGRSNPTAAAQDILTFPPKPIQAVAASAVVSPYAKVDLEGCRKWIESLPPLPRNRAAPSLVTEWCKQNPAAASSWAAQLTPPDLQTAALREAGSAWARRDGPAALAYGLTLAEGPGREAFLTACLRAYVSVKPGDAAGWLGKQTALPSFEKLAKEMTSQWLQFDPQASAEWVASLPDQPQREKILQDVVNQWKKSDPDSTARFVGTHPSISDDFKSRNLIR